MGGNFSVDQFCAIQRRQEAFVKAERDDPPLVVSRPRLWAFGADVPETDAIKWLLREAGEAFVDILDDDQQKPTTPAAARTCIGISRRVGIQQNVMADFTVFLIGVADTEPQKWWQRLLRRKVPPPRIIYFACPWVHVNALDEARKVLLAAGVRFPGWHRWKREAQPAQPASQTLH